MSEAAAQAAMARVKVGQGVVQGRLQLCRL